MKYSQNEIYHLNGEQLPIRNVFHSDNFSNNLAVKLIMLHFLFAQEH